ncbi:hypothetical protein BDV06DRAFT_84781 [Aspergillus oleicola]
MKFYTTAAIIPFLPLLASAVPCATSTASVSAAPTSSSSPSGVPYAGAGAGSGLTPAQIKLIAPKSASCANVTTFTDECRTAEQAAPALTTAFLNYGVTSKAEQAAVLGLIAFESGEFRYARNHFPEPGNPGQGTRNMQSPTFNQEYGASFPSIADRIAEAGDDLSAMLDIILEDPVRDFGSGAWFLTNHCDMEFRAPLQTGSEEGWEGFITECVGTDANGDRRGYWVKAKQALGI